MRTISIRLNDQEEYYLAQVMMINKCTVKDAVIMGLITLSGEYSPLMEYKDRLIDRVERQVITKTGKSLRTYCNEQGIRRRDVAGLCYRLEHGAQVRGFGDTNRWRDKQDDRLYRTRTAYIIDLFRNDLKIDIEKGA